MEIRFTLRRFAVSGRIHGYDEQGAELRSIILEVSIVVRPKCIRTAVNRGPVEQCTIGSRGPGNPNAGIATYARNRIAG